MPEVKIGNDNFMICLGGDTYLSEPLEQDTIVSQYNESTQKFNISIINPSDKTKYLFENDLLYIGMTFHDSQSHYHGTRDTSCHRRVYSRHPRWYLPGIILSNGIFTDSGDIDLVYQMTSMSNFEFKAPNRYIDAMFLPTHVWQMMNYGDNHSNPPAKEYYYINFRFILISMKCGRPYKTRSPIYTVYHDRHQ